MLDFVRSLDLHNRNTSATIQGAQGYGLGRPQFAMPTAESLAVTGAGSPRPANVVRGEIQLRHVPTEPIALAATSTKACGRGVWPPPSRVTPRR
jgi:hypothetical protein